MRVSRSRCANQLTTQRFSHQTCTHTHTNFATFDYIYRHFTAAGARFSWPATGHPVHSHFTPQRRSCRPLDFPVAGTPLSAHARSFSETIEKSSEPKKKQQPLSTLCACVCVTCVFKIHYCCRVNAHLMRDETQAATSRCTYISTCIETHTHTHSYYARIIKGCIVCGWRARVFAFVSGCYK